jgi:hypothetical protein
VRWEAIDALTARLVVPFGARQDSIILAYGGPTGLIRSMESLRFRAPRDRQQLVERFEPPDWRTFRGLRIPSSGALTWLDQGRPWLVLDLEEVAYNVDVAEDLRPCGAEALAVLASPVLVAREP